MTTVQSGTRTLQNYVGGEFVAPSADRTLDVLNPATQETLALVPMSSASDLDSAVRAAREAFPAWRSKPVIQRAQWLFSLRERLSEHTDELARLVTIEMGKTIGDARAEVGRMIEMVELATAIPTTMQGRNLENVATNVDVETIRQPVGVCAAIVPFNFPAMVPFWFLPFAIACGNTFVLKPSEQVPLTQNRVFELIDDLGLPPGVINLVNGDREVVDAILDHPDIDAVSFVGSARVARHVYERAAANGKRVQALGGAKNHMVVMPDAVVDKTVDGILSSAFGAAGQRCMAGSVVVTVGEAHDKLVPPLAEAAGALRVGDGLDESVAVGPVISCGARERIEGWIDKAAADGAEVVVDGRGADPDSAFVGPTILTSVSRDADILREEVFGPVLAIVRAKSVEDAITIENASSYGNAASVFTESGGVARYVMEHASAGMVGVNVGVPVPREPFSFGGWNDSKFGVGDITGRGSIEFWTKSKKMTTKWNKEAGVNWMS